DFRFVAQVDVNIARFGHFRHYTEPVGGVWHDGVGADLVIAEIVGHERLIEQNVVDVCGRGVFIFKRKGRCSDERTGTEKIVNGLEWRIGGASRRQSKGRLESADQGASNTGSFASTF